MSAVIRERMSSTPEMIAVFSDAALLRHALAFEIALADACAAVGLATAAEAAAIKDACGVAPDPEKLAEQAAHAGTLAIPLVAELRERITKKNPAAAAKLHLGATSQDVHDTALVLQCQAGLQLIARDVATLQKDLADLAVRHAATPMLGRTLLQSAQPITFGLKVAQWLLGIRAADTRIQQESQAAFALQFGGAAGTRAGLGGKGAAISAHMARALNVADPVAPWHSRRDHLVALGSALGILTGSLAKIARDIALLAQNEIGEVFEPKVAGRGGSSAMAHKRNPTGCQVAISAQIRVTGLVTSLMTAALAQEHERGLGGWQTEAPLLSEIFLLTHGALHAMGGVVSGLDVQPAAMKRNLDAAGLGTDVGEAITLVPQILDGKKAS